MNKPLSPAEIAQHTRTIYESLHRAPRLVSEVSESIRRDVAEIRADYERSEKEYYRLHDIFAEGRACRDCPMCSAHDGGRGEQGYRLCDVIEQRLASDKCPAIEREREKCDE